MSAAPGDRVVVRSQRGADRDGEVVDVQGQDGGPPYVVRWTRTGEESLFFPGPGTVIEPAARESAG
ncbi:protein of unknown function [Georgenia satyanarayanai]|uniref:DUF1918 domain-containing protein n=1 Tax=Georgenia satyanarayanai TaxID=860221 RepID=A0A2Y9AR39_9MICO|nr:DUF1918 domain-containing protein [Georgenia satyanarayanai]PYF98361.1 uncharacterized protein DUF1918 [Georgenia satyanarayanai]SSA44957.1 protein of unknown function [Georgenia satyanarayanai]